jgi:integrase
VLGKLVNRTILNGDSITTFRAAIKSKYTLDPYERRLLDFLNSIGMTCDQFVTLAKTNPSEAEKSIITFILKQKERAQQRQIANATVNNKLKPIKLLLEMNDVILNWKKIKRLLPAGRRFALDRIPTIEELQTILEHCDIRGRALTLLFCSSGIREGAVESLKVRNLTPIESEEKGIADNINNKKILGKLTVYEAETDDQYITFTTPEAYEAIQKYLEWREAHGEKIADSSPLFRDKFDPLVTAYLTYYGGKPEQPKVLAGSTVRAYYNRLFYECKFRIEPKKRHEFTVHGFRKWFKTRCENAGVKPIVTELLMGHSVGISDSYYRPSEKDLLEEYCKALDWLTITRENQLRNQLSELTAKDEEDIVKLKQKDIMNSDAIANLSDQYLKLMADFERLKSKVK